MLENTLPSFLCFYDDQMEIFSFGISTRILNWSIIFDETLWGIPRREQKSLLPDKLRRRFEAQVVKKLIAIENWPFVFSMIENKQPPSQTHAQLAMTYVYLDTLPGFTWS